MKKISLLILTVLVILTAVLVVSSCGSDACTHEFKSPKTLKEPDCVSVGYSFTECSLCKFGTVEIIHHKGGHVPELIPAIAGDCYTEGFTEGERCSVCKKVIKEPKSLGANQHTFSGGVCVVCGANENSDGIEFILNYDKQSYSVKSIGTCKGESIVIPSTYEGLPVTSIVDGAFKDCKSIKTIEVPNSVVSIGKGAFSGCSGLVRLTLPFVGGALNTDNQPSQKTLFGYIFGDTSVEGTYGIKQYISKSESYATYIPKSLSSVKITNGTLLYGTFQNVSSIVTLEIGGNATRVEDRAFSGCTSLSELYLPSNITYVGSYAFQKCSALKEIDLSKATFIGDNALSACPNLESVTLCDDLTELYEATFYNCTGLKTVVLPKNLTKIGNHVFQSCTKLESINLPEGLAEIGDYAFAKCESLAQIILPSTVRSAGEYAFFNCTGAKKVVLNNGIEKLGEKLLSGCSSLERLEIPVSVTALGKDMLRGCSSLNEIIIDDSNPELASVDGILYSKDLKTLILYTPGRAGESFEIPAHVEKIEAYAFYQNTGVVNVIIPSTVKVIGESAFEKATALKTVTVGGVKEIAKNVFYDCTALETVNFSEDVEKIGEYAFYGAGLKELTLPENILEIGRYSFAGCKKLKTLNLPYLKKISEASFSSCDSLESITMSDSVTEIGPYGFAKCTGLKSIKIGKGVTKIEKYAFMDCSALVNAYIPISVETIGEGAFYKCPTTGMISAEAQEQPSGWNEKWNYSKVPVLWGATE